jgi:hypothetical protein
MHRRFLYVTFALLILFGTSRSYSSAGDAPESVTVKWDKTVIVSKTSATFQVVVNPLLRREAKTHDRVFEGIRDLGCDYVRYVPWRPYPKLVVAELEPPHDGKTSWDFSLIDPMMEDMMKATAGHSVMINFSTIPQWMFKTEKPVPYPVNPDEVFWDYQQGSEFRDPSLKEVTDYYARLLSWYTKGGFTDEYGKRHESGHHYQIDYWEVMNEIDLEHNMTPQLYARLYDSIVTALRKIQPQMKYVALALAYPAKHPEQFEYFLDPKNHQAGIPLDMISYHLYAEGTASDETFEVDRFAFFDQADMLMDAVRYIETIRKRLSPRTRTAVNETGTADPSDDEPENAYKGPPDAYWAMSAVWFAYLYAGLARQGIDVVGESQMVGYPTQFPSLTMVNWNSGQPNARYWVLKLIHDNFGPGDKLVETDSPISRMYASYALAQGFVTRDGKRKLLLANKRDRSFDFSIPGGDGAEVVYVDRTTGSQPPVTTHLKGDRMTLRGLAVAVVTLPK